jgi:hypothetical protein
MSKAFCPAVEIGLSAAFDRRALDDVFQVGLVAFIWVSRQALCSNAKGQLIRLSYSGDLP